jgi:hypothetical protein
MNKYIFNYDNNPNLPKYNEENIKHNQYIRIDYVQNLFNIYYIDNIPDNNYKINEINNTIILFLISTSNSAHSISEIIDFLNYYKNKENYIGISIYIKTKMPFLYELITIFIPENKIILLYDNIIYKIDILILYRNHHFNYLKNWDNISFLKNNNILYFNNLENIKENFYSNSLFLFDKVEEIYSNNKDKYILYDNICLIKTNIDKFVATPNRCLDNLNDEIINIFNNNNIKVLSINNFKNIYEYICVFYHAKNIIVSYGGVACTNRFFCNKNSNIILIANLYYKNEYEYNNKNQLYWHIRHSHIFPAKKQKVLLDFENNININNINNIINLLE